jgi:hypothetical protein
MNARALTLALVAAAGAPAFAQTGQVTYTLSWSEAAGGNGNGILEPGESAQIVLRASFTPAVGSPITYEPPPGTGSGTVAGLGMINFDLAGDCINHQGTWTLSGTGFQGTTGTTWGVRTGWGFGMPGQVMPNGDVIGCLAGQFRVSSADPTNPVVEIWRGKWTPSSWTARFVIFRVRAAEAAGLQHSSLAVQIDPTPQYALINVAAQFSQIYIPIGQAVLVPCPCYANCDGSTGTPVLTVNDFVCYMSRFAAGDAYANCDGSTSPPVLTVNDFVCFQAQFASGCL